MSAIDDVVTGFEAECKRDGYYFMLEKTESARAELAQLRAAAAERDELKAKANVSICAWCGQECEKTSEGIAQHVITCDKRPEHAMLIEFEKLLSERNELRVHLDALYSELAQATGHEYTPGANFDAHEAIGQLVERADNLERIIALNKYVTPPYDIADSATAELAVMLVDADERIAELESDLSNMSRGWDCANKRADNLERIIALNKYITPPYDIADSATAELAVMLVDADERIAALEAANNTRKDTIIWLKGQYDYDERVIVGDVIHRLESTHAPTAPAPQGTPYFDTKQAYRKALEKVERIWVAYSVSDEHLAALGMYTTAARALNEADMEKQYHE